MTLSTARLSLQPWTEAYFDDLHALAQLPEIVRYVGDGRPWSRELSLAKHRATLTHWVEHGFGWYAVSDGTFAGVVSLVRRSPALSGLGVEAVEMGWWVAPPAWGRGYATEATAAVRDQVFGNGLASRLLAVYSPENAASSRVVEKLGFVVRGDYFEDGRPFRRAVLEAPVR